MSSKSLSGGTSKDKRIVLNYSSCKYSIVAEAARETGWLLDPKGTRVWDVCWSDRTRGTEDLVRKASFFQRINRFPAMVEIYNKNSLARSLAKVRSFSPTEYNYYPATWELPQSRAELSRFMDQNPSTWFIVKPCIGSQGTGVYIAKSWEDIFDEGECVVQEYISRPYLIEGLKFDLRVYVLVLSSDPLRIFIYKEGLVRFCTVPYSQPSTDNSECLYMHITNFALNKDHEDFVESYENNQEKASKRKLSWLMCWLQSQGHDTGKLWTDIKDIIIKTLISIKPALTHSIKSCKEHSGNRNPLTCFELLGFDILLDEKLRPYLLEVNHSPSLHADSYVDNSVKRPLLTDTFRLISVDPCDRDEFLKMENLKTKERLYGEVYASAHSSTSETHRRRRRGCEQYFKSLTAAFAWRKHLMRESENLGHFELIFPCDHNAVKKVLYSRLLELSSQIYVTNSVLMRRTLSSSQVLQRRVNSLPQIVSKESSDRSINSDASVGERGILSPSPVVQHPTELQSSYVPITYTPSVYSSDKNAILEICEDEVVPTPPSRRKKKSKKSSKLKEISTFVSEIEPQTVDKSTDPTIIATIPSESVETMDLSCIPPQRPPLPKSQDKDDKESSTEGSPRPPSRSRERKSRGSSAKSSRHAKLIKSEDAKSVRSISIPPTKSKSKAMNKASSTRAFPSPRLYENLDEKDEEDVDDEAQEIVMTAAMQGLLQSYRAQMMSLRSDNLLHHIKEYGENFYEDVDDFDVNVNLNTNFDDFNLSEDELQAYSAREPLTSVDRDELVQLRGINSARARIQSVKGSLYTVSESSEA